MIIDSASGSCQMMSLQPVSNILYYLYNNGRIQSTCSSGIIKRHNNYGNKLTLFSFVLGVRREVLHCWWKDLMPGIFSSIDFLFKMQESKREILYENRNG